MKTRVPREFVERPHDMDTWTAAAEKPSERTYCRAAIAKNAFALRLSLKVHLPWGSPPRVALKGGPPRQNALVC